MNFIFEYVYKENGGDLGKLFGYLKYISLDFCPLKKVKIWENSPNLKLNIFSKLQNF